MKQFLKAVAFLSVIVCPLQEVMAQEDAGVPRPRIVAWNLYEENDVLTGTDQHYTQGLKIGWFREQEGSPEWAERIAPRIWALLGDEQLPFGFNAGWSLGQNIYTPENITRSTIDINDRPWAGWLYAGRLIQVGSDCDPEADVPEVAKCREQQHTFELDLGVVGPLSGAEWAQTKLHELIESSEPQGWDNQLDNEPGLLLLYRGKWRFVNSSSTIDLIPQAGGALGNVLTYIEAGATIRLGFNLTGFGVDPIPAVQRRPKPIWEAYAFAGAEGRAVALNIFLDGNNFQESYSVDKEPLVYDLKTGASARYKAWRLTYTLVKRSEEFKPRSGRNLGPQDFGSVVVSWERFFE